jgi:hypothetical protein
MAAFFAFVDRRELGALYQRLPLHGVSYAALEQVSQRRARAS